MRLSRRDLLIGAGLTLLAPAQLRAQSAPDRDHQIKLDLPILAEDATAVPVQVGVDHPMEPDHFIQWIDITLERDPVPHKGKFLFTPSNGRAWVAFPMRSGAGGVVTAVAECSRHGRFAGTREMRVAEGGCATGPEPVDRQRAGNPMLRVPAPARPGEIVEVRTRIIHGSHTGLALKNGRLVRESPELYVRQMLVYLDDQRVSEFQMTSAVSPNPVIRFPLRAARNGTLRVLFVNSEGQRWEVSQPVKV
jgi:desulfoferrodoxin (superoxide reductase-like protein)